MTKDKIKVEGNTLLVFHCPACNRQHAVPYFSHRGPRWSWNGRTDAPTLMPSIRVEGIVPLSGADLSELDRRHHVQPKYYLCHSFITEGQIQYLSDCTHALAGQVVDLPDIES